MGELTPTMQVKLLRALEGGGYTPVGGNKAKYSDVRIITATNEDMLAWIPTELNSTNSEWLLNSMPWSLL